MLRWLIGKRLDAAEKQLGVSVDYVRHILRVSLPAFFKFTKVLPLAAYRKKLPAAPRHVACLVAVRHEDCGTCVQIGVNLARKDRVDPEILRAVVAGRPEDLPEELADVYHFAEVVVSAGEPEEALREKVRRRYGEEAFVELALAIASCRIFPTTKRALGYATSCSRVSIEV
jgi:alkylhydroperoxidase family enzyme